MSCTKLCLGMVFLLNCREAPKMPLPPMPELSSSLMDRGCKSGSNAAAVLFVRQIKYVNVLKNFLDQCGATIQDARFNIKILSEQILGAQSVMSIERSKIKDIQDNEIPKIQQEIKDIQSEFQDVKLPQHDALCRAQAAAIGFAPLTSALAHKTAKPDGEYVGMTEDQRHAYECSLEILDACDELQRDPSKPPELFVEKASDAKACKRYESQIKLYEKVLTRLTDEKRIKIAKRKINELKAEMAEVCGGGEKTDWKKKCIAQWEQLKKTPWSFIDLMNDSMIENLSVSTKDLQYPFKVDQIRGIAQSFSNALQDLKKITALFSQNLANAKKEIEANVDKIKAKNQEMIDAHNNMVAQHNQIDHYKEEVAYNQQLIGNAHDGISNAKKVIMDLKNQIQIKARDTTMFNNCPFWLQDALGA